MDYPLIKLKYYHALLKDIFNFIKKPHNVAAGDKKSTRIKIYDTIGLYLLKFIFLIPLIIFFALVYDPENVQSENMADRFFPFMLLLVGGVILPLIEEIGFRLSLKFKPIYFALSSSVLTYYFLTKVIYQTKNSAVDESFLTRTSIAIILGLILFPIFNAKLIKEKLADFWNNHFPCIFYLSCVVFAWIHISKYEVNLVNVLLLPILTLPQLMSAIIYGYTRVSFGFKYPLFLHMFVNLFAISLSFLPLAD